MLNAILSILLISFLVLYFKTRLKKYSWYDFSRKFGNCNGEFGVYNLTKKTEECTYADKKIIDKYDTVFKTEIDKDTSYMIKISSSNAKGCEIDMLNYVKPITDKYDTQSVTLRIQTNPWRYAPHYDTINQIAHMLHGTKKWILWNTHFKNIDETKKFLHDINNLNYEDMKIYLKNREIQYETKIMRPGDSLYIKCGTWHYVENVNTTRGCIMLNLELESDTLYSLEENFKKLWPIQYTKYVNNEFY